MTVVIKRRISRTSTACAEAYTIRDSSSHVFQAIHAANLLWYTVNLDNLYAVVKSVYAHDNQLNFKDKCLLQR